MGRRDDTAAAPPLEDVESFLTFGPLNQGPPDLTDEQAEAAWRAHGDTIMATWPRDRPGFRPWAFWRFEVGVEYTEDREAELLLLAERGDLFDEELEALAEKRRYWHINEERWHTDPKAIELYERVLNVQQ